jgi:hypothetical protein
MRSASNIAGPMVVRSAPSAMRKLIRGGYPSNIGKASEQRYSRQWPFLARGSIAFPAENYRADHDAFDRSWRSYRRFYRGHDRRTSAARKRGSALRAIPRPRRSISFVAIRGKWRRRPSLLAPEVGLISLNKGSIKEMRLTPSDRRRRRVVLGPRSLTSRVRQRPAGAPAARALGAAECPTLWHASVPPTSNSSARCISLRAGAAAIDAGPDRQHHRALHRTASAKVT